MGTCLSEKLIERYVAGDQIRIGQTTLLFTDKDFADRESALSHLEW